MRDLARFTRVRAVVSNLGRLLLAGVLLTFAATNESVAKKPPTFSIHRGLNVAGPFASFITPPIAVDSDTSRQRVFRGLAAYVDQPYQNPRNIRQAGFDYVRMSVNPAIILRARGALRRQLLSEVRDGVVAYRQAGLKVLVNLQFWTPDEVWNWDTVLSGEAADYVAYRIVVGDVAKLLTGFPAGSVALEPMNEPKMADCDDARTGWFVKQHDFLHEVRRRNRFLPVVFCGCLGQLDGLLKLKAQDAALQDHNVIYSFHFYEPFFFTHQGSPFHYTYVDSVRYPASASTQEASLAAAYRTIGAAPLTEDRKAALRLEAKGEFANYYRSGAGRGLIRQRFAAAARWARSLGIEPSNIMIGEFAALSWAESPAADYRRSRVAWNRDVREEAEANGFAWTFWNSPEKVDVLEALGYQSAGTVGKGGREHCLGPAC